MKDFKHACFISYRNGTVIDGQPQNDLLNEFSKTLREALTSEFRALLNPHLNEPVFRDFDVLKTADYLEEKIADALCRSACMVVVYTPSYFDESKSYCAREYLAMREREQHCFDILGQNNSKKSLIFTVILRGKKNELPDELSANVYEDFVSFDATMSNEITLPLRRKIKEIANEIARIYRYLRKEEKNKNLKLCEHCDQFKLPETNNDLKVFIKEMNSKLEKDNPFS